MECEKFDEKDRKCILCKQANEIFNMMIKSKNEYGALGWQLIEHRVAHILSKYSNKELVILTELIDDLCKTEIEMYERRN